MISCRSLSKSYDKVDVLRNVSIDFEKGSLSSIVGASGAGKSTLLHIMGTLDKADKGQLIIDGTDTSTLSTKELSEFRNKHIGFIFQFHHLLPELTAIENACLPAYILGEDEKSANRRGSELLERLSLSDRLQHKPSEMSGGEQQRVALARALINRPKILLADEPTGNLDQANAEEVLQLLLEMRSEFGITTVIVTHDMNIASRTGRVLTMKDGFIVN
ncbi:MAG: ABC transporter ATP-binding protein [Saprospiraceae bacterium]|nr:ABC transporter ATP-binding protein [Saprospiraceae bacterium]